MTYKSIQPSTKTELEQRFGESQIYPIAHPVRDLWNAWTCPVHLLPYLAWALSVDYWREDWTEQQKRHAIANSFIAHKYKGTVGAVKAVLQPFGYGIEIKEWHQTKPQGVAGTFKVQLLSNHQSLKQEDYQEIRRLIETTKPVSRVLGGLIFTVFSHAQMTVRGACVIGENITIFPYVPSQLETRQAVNAIAATHPISTMTIYPYAQTQAQTQYAVNAIAVTHPVNQITIKPKE